MAAFMEPVVEAFQKVAFDKLFDEDGGDTVSGFNLAEIEPEISERLQSFPVDKLLEAANSLYNLLREAPANGQAVEGLREENILVLIDKAVDPDVPLKRVFPILAALIYSGLKTKSENGTATAGCTAAAIYILLCTATKGNIPASLHHTLGMTTLFIPCLYSKSLDMLSQPDLWEKKKAAQKKGRKQDQRDVAGIETIGDLDIVTDVQWEEAQFMLIKAMLVFVRNLDLNAVPFNMGRLCRVLAHFWKRELENTKLTFVVPISSNLTGLVNRWQYVAKCYSLLLHESQKETLLENLAAIFWAFEPGLLRLTETLSTYPVPPAAVRNLATNIAEFCAEIIRHISGDQDCDDVIVAFMQDIFSNIPDASEYRRQNAETFVYLLDAMPQPTRNTILQFVAMDSDADRARSRNVALAIMQSLLDRNWQGVNVPHLKCTTCRAIVLEMCCRRLMDKSTKIRSAAGNLLSYVLENDPLAFQMPENEGLKEDAQQGQVRFRKVFAVALNGICDVSAMSRGTYIKVVGKMLAVDFSLFDETVKDGILRAAQDPSKQVRRFNIDVICGLANQHPGNKELLDVWIRGVFHCYMDSELTVKERVMEVFQNTVMSPILAHDPSPEAVTFAWNLLSTICKDELGNLRLLRQILHDMVKAGIVNAKSFDKIRDHLTTDHQQMAWILLAELAMLLGKRVNTDFTMELIEDRNFEPDDDIFGSSLFKIIRSSFLSGNKAAKNRLDTLEAVFPRIRGFASAIEAVRAILEGCNVTTSDKEFEKWAEGQLYQAAWNLHQQLQEYQEALQHPADAENDGNNTKLEEKVAFNLRLVGELGKHLGLGKPGARVKGNIRELNAVELIAKACDFEEEFKFGASVRAHAVFAIGRLCLGAKQLTWEYTGKIVDLAHSRRTDIGLRRDAIEVVFDLLKMFGDVVESHLGKVYSWLGDTCSQIRGDVINHLHDLLLNEHLQWNPTVFYNFLTSVSDPNPVVRAWVRSCLRSLIKKRNQCYTDFVEAVVFLNQCVEHPRFKAAHVATAKGAVFPLVGRAKLPKRMEIYSFMLKQMTDEHKRMIYGRIMEQVLMPVVVDELSITGRNCEYRDVLGDVVRILGLKEMEFSVFNKNAAEDEAEDGEGDNPDAEQAEDDEQRKLDKQTNAQKKEIWIKFRQEIIQRTLLPVLASLYRKIKMIDDRDLFNATVQLVDKLTTSSEINLAELAQSTSGTEGQVLKALAMDIVRIREVEKQRTATPAPREPSVPVGGDNVPLFPFLQQQPATPAVLSDDLVSNPASTPGEAPRAARRREASPEFQQPAQPPLRVQKTKGHPAQRQKRGTVNTEEELSEPGSSLSTVADVSMRKPKRIAGGQGESPNSSDNASPNVTQRPRRTAAARAVKATAASFQSVNAKKQKADISQSSTTGKSKTSKAAKDPRKNAGKKDDSRSKPESEEDNDDNDTVASEITIVEKPRGRTRNEKNKGDMSIGPSRAISTPVKNTIKTDNLTFSADISVIEPPSGQGADRTLRSNAKCGKNKKK